MKSIALILTLFSLTMVGCSSTPERKLTYLPSESFAKNLMKVASPVVWDLDDAQAVKNSTTSKDSSYGFELSYAALGAASNTDSLTSALSGAGVYGLAALAIPDNITASQRGYLLLVISESSLNSYEGIDIDEKSFNAFQDRYFNILKNNYLDIEDKLYTSRGATVKGITYNESMLGDYYSLEFEGLPIESMKGRDCPSGCRAFVSKSRVKVSQKLPSSFASEILGNDVNESYYAISYHGYFASNAVLNIDQYIPYLDHDMFIYRPKFDIDGYKVPVVLTHDEIRFFIKPNPNTLTKAQ